MRFKLKVVPESVSGIQSVLNCALENLVRAAKRKRVKMRLSIRLMILFFD